MSNEPVKPGAKIILVVDDNPIILKATSIALKSRGYQVSIALGGPEAIGLVRKEKPDLILLDLSFPPDPANIGGPMRDGFLIIEWLRRIPEGEKVPIMIISGTKPEEYQSRALAAGVLACFHKPLKNDELLASIQTALAKQAGQS